MNRARVAAVVGGVTWGVLLGAWVLAHGSQQSPRGATVLGQDATAIWRLLIIPVLSMFVALAALRPHLGPLSSAGKVAHCAALVSLGALAVGVYLQTSVVDPDRQFQHPAVQAGWWLFILALVPGLTAAMSVLGWSVLRRGSRAGIAALAIGVAAPSPVLAASLHVVSSGTAAWDIGLIVLNGLFGLAWLGLLVVPDRPEID